jgi:hypothetical protein
VRTVAILRIIAATLLALLILAVLIPLTIPAAICELLRDTEPDKDTYYRIL